ncbi:MAG TPA: Gfo/Idh/MocA family oxidoreductase [Candidatus Limnocylindrales bacterium]|nr:Gfo/Idh/MocA family oxidoreductase [Candidatus Limnocylindrales bacterium]
MPRNAAPRLRWGILGTGAINDRVLRHGREARAEFVAVGSRTPDRAADFASRHGIERAHGSYDDLLGDPLVEAVYICLPNSLHHPWTLRALAAGKHVLCEKPYTRRPAEVVEAFDAADVARLQLMEGFMWRHTPQARRFVELLPQIGDLRAIRATFSFVLTNPSDIRVSASLDGGSLMDVGAYCVSGARLVTGSEPEAVHGDQLLGPSGVDVRFTGMLRFAGGVVATIACGFDFEHATLEAIGGAGSIFLRDPWTGSARTITVNGRDVDVEPADPYRLELDNFAAAVRGDEAPLLGRADALGQARAIEALYRAAAAGEAVKVAS